MLSPNGRSAVGTLAAVAVLGTGGAYFAGTALADVAHRSEQAAAQASPEAPAGAERQDALPRAGEPEMLTVAVAEPSREAERTARHTEKGGSATRTAATDEAVDASGRETRRSEGSAAREARQGARADQGRRHDSEKAAAKALEKRDERANERGHGGR